MVDRAAPEDGAATGWLKLGALAAPVVALAIWGSASRVGGDRLGEESTGLFAPCLLAGVVLASATGYLFHRRRAVTGIVVASMILPWAGASYGMAKWLNAASVDDDDEQPVDCVLTSKQRAEAQRGVDLGWVYGYRCTVEGGVELHGTVHDQAALPIAAEVGETVRMNAARGRFGIWLRRSGPITPPPR